MTNGTDLPEYSFVWDDPFYVDQFLSKFNHDNNYTYNGRQLVVGDTITINDGTYNTQWKIAGFDCEKSRIASDDTMYDNGYGIALIPKIIIGDVSKWNSTLDGAYYSSYIRNTTLPIIVTKLQSILGDHLINRNVLLSNSVNSNGYSDAYIWTNDYATLMSTTQLGKEIATGSNKYDDGEANYRLPLFSDDTSRKTSIYNYWTRGAAGSGGGNYYAWYVYKGAFDTDGLRNSNSVRPLIYIH